MAVAFSIVGTTGLNFTGNAVTTATSGAGTSTATKFAVGIAWLTNASGQTVSLAVTDSKSNTYVQKGAVVNFTNGDGGVAWFVCETGTNGASHTATATATVGGTGGQLFEMQATLIQMTGAATTAFDVVNQYTTAPGTSNASMSLATGTLTQASEGVLALWLIDGSGDAGAAWASSNLTIIDSSIGDGTNTPAFLLGTMQAPTTAGVTTNAQYTATATPTHAQLAQLVTFEQAGSGVTVALTGQRATFAAGTVTQSRTVALTGQAATFTPGTLSILNLTALYGEVRRPGPGVSPDYTKVFRPRQFASPPNNNVTVALTGQRATFSTGVLAPFTTVALNGQGAVFTPGIISVAGSGNVTVALTGQAATFSAGLLQVSSTVPLVGTGATFTPGTLTPGMSLTLTGSAANFSAGALAPNFTLGLTGAAATFTAGTGIPSTSSTVALTGARATFRAGQMLPSGGTPVGDTNPHNVEFIYNIGTMMGRR